MLSMTTEGRGSVDVWCGINFLFCFVFVIEKEGRKLTPVSDVVEITEHLLLVGREDPGLTGRRQDGRLRGELVVEVADVLAPLDCRNERRPYLLGQEAVPVDILVEMR